MEKLQLKKRKFGKLRAISYRIKDRRTFWKCICDCGRITEVRGSSLTSGNSTACGDCQQGRLSKPGNGGFKKLYGNYKNRARNVLKVSFKLSHSQFRKITKQDCYYCGDPPFQIIAYKRRNRTERAINNSSYCYNGVDRVDNTKGYVIGNVVSACGICNVIKNSCTLKIAQKMIEFKKRYG